jgi:hypothetical protein
MNVIARKFLACIGIAATLSATAIPTLAAAQTVTVNIQTNHYSRVYVRFFSQDRETTWPGGDDAYEIADDATHQYVLECTDDENICYGAFDTILTDGGDYWGVGKDGTEGCDACCLHCDGGTHSFTLNG